MARRVGRPRTARRTAATRRNSGDVLVKVARTGGVVTEVALNGEKTVEEALEIANITYTKGDRVRVNGREANVDTQLANGDIVTVAGKIEGGREE